MCCVLLLKAAKEEESRKNTSAQLLAQNEIEGHLPYACALQSSHGPHCFAMGSNPIKWPKRSTARPAVPCSLG